MTQYIFKITFLYIFASDSHPITTSSSENIQNADFKKLSTNVKGKAVPITGHGGRWR
jgi:hypothetical protein